MNGVINVYKEKGFTSFDVCAKLRGILKTKKIGHTGTLDPDAEGVLPVCVGNATKLCELLTDKDKTYETVLYLGRTTDTEDMTGNVLIERPVSCTKAEVTAVIERFVGKQQQVPPMYSALKVNGQKLCDLARQGIVVERKAREITIHSIHIIDMVCEEDGAVREVKMSVSCSKGTYIRTLCKDIGEALGCGGCMKQLLRTKVSVFEVAHSKTLSQIDDIVKNERINDILVPVDSLFLHLSKAIVKQENDVYLYNGNKLRPDQMDVTLKREATGRFELRVYDSKVTFLGIYEYLPEEKCYKPVKMFLN